MYLHQLVLILNYFSLQLAFSYTRMQLLPTLMSAIQHTGCDEVTNFSKQLRGGRSVVIHPYDIYFSSIYIRRALVSVFSRVSLHLIVWLCFVTFVAGLVH